MQIAAEIVEAGNRKLQRGDAPYGTAAVLVGEASPPDLDGTRWLLYVTDGTIGGVVPVSLPGSNGGRVAMPVEAEILEATVAGRTANFASESRLPDFLAKYAECEQGVVLHRGDLQR
jgi:hypothetical protein